MRTAHIRGEVKNSSETLKPRMFASVNFGVAATAVTVETTAISAPRSAIWTTVAKWAVFVLPHQSGVLRSEK
jgi:hypothetical protein